MQLKTKHAVYSNDFILLGTDNVLSGDPFGVEPDLLLLHKTKQTKGSICGWNLPLAQFSFPLILVYGNVLYINESKIKENENSTN